MIWQRKTDLRFACLLICSVCFVAASEAQEPTTRYREARRGTYQPPTIVRDSTAKKQSEQPIRQVVFQADEPYEGLGECCSDEGCACGSTLSDFETGCDCCYDSHCDGCPPGGGGGSIFGSGFSCERIFCSAEYMMWWRRGQALPALVTSSPAGSLVNQAGILGNAGTTVLLGNETQDMNMTNGGRATLGMWIDQCMNYSVVLRFWSTGEETRGFFADSTTDAFIGIPFNDAALAGNPPNAFLVVEQLSDGTTGGAGITNGATGSVDVRTESQVYGGDALFRKKIQQGYGARTELVLGYQTMRIDERLRIAATRTGIGTTNTGVLISTFDEFKAMNEFHGAALGFDGMYREDRWTWRLLTKLGFGNLHRAIRIRGSGTRDNAGGGGPVTSANGFFAKTTNTGTFTSDKFSFLPEVNVAVGYRLTDSVDFSIGYNYLLVTNAIQAAGSIDTTVGNAADGSPVNGRPAVLMTDDDYWLHGIQFSMHHQY